MPTTAITCITRSCHLIEIDGRTFLTDPWFSTRPCYYQGEPIAAGIGDLPALDGMLITHAHHDHSDPQAFVAYR
jgi:L-ascorbate metabolism protein UlaG (beta-lactamase superfamily)